MSRKTVKIQLHHDISTEVPTKRVNPGHNILLRFWFGIWNLLAKAAFTVGLALIAVIRLPISLFYAASLPQLSGKQLKSLGGFSVLLLFALIPFLTVNLIGEGWRLGGSVLGVSDEALQSIAQAKEAVSRQDYELAETNFADALASLEQIQLQLNDSSGIIQASSKLAPASVNTSNLLVAATNLTEAGLAATKLLNEINSLSFTAQGIATTNEKTTQESLLHLSQQSRILHEKLATADRLLAPFNTELLPAEYQLAVNQAKALIKDLNVQTAQLAELSELLNQLMLGQKNYLVILQNNNELRPTGGFIGTIAQGKLSNGLVEKLDIRTVYDLDGQLNEWLIPPGPLQTVNHRLFLRDSNWFVNFPDSARQLSIMYEKSSGETPDLIMAVTPDVFIEFLNLTGPITLPAYNVTITPDNFVEQIQASTSVAYDKQANQPKQLLADLYPALMQRINELSKGQPALMLGVLQKQLSRKNILLYSRDQNLQNKLALYRWDGAVADFAGDYLYINSANLNGSKTDLALERSATLTTNIELGGRIRNQLQYTVRNPLPSSTGLHNKSWVRFMVPTGAKLLGFSGFNESKPLQLPDAQYSWLDQVSAWEQSLQHDSSAQIHIGEEAGKTFFAGWVEVLAGESKTVSITYELPHDLNWRVANYQILLEKQPGVASLQLSHQINFPGRKVEWLNKTLAGQAQTTEQVNYRSELITDSYAGVVLIPK